MRRRAGGYRFDDGYGYELETGGRCVSPPDMTWMTRLMPYLVKYGSGIPMPILLGWIEVESGGAICSTTKYDERGYFQLMPDESKFFRLDHARLSTDAEYSVAGGIKAVRFYADRVRKLGIDAGADSFWPLTKLHHAIGMGAAPKLVHAAAAGGVDTRVWGAIARYIAAHATELRHSVGYEPIRFVLNVNKTLSEGLRLWALWQARTAKAPTITPPIVPLPIVPPPLAPAPIAPPAPAHPAAPPAVHAPPASTTSGVEADSNMTTHIACLHGLQDQHRGISFVQRYLRNLSTREARALTAAGFTIVSCYEETAANHLTATHIAYFTRAQGQHDGRRGCTQAHRIGQPAGTPIYFAVDTDPNSKPELTAMRRGVLEYLEGVRDGYHQYAADMQAKNVAPIAYDIGIYGSGCVLDWARAQGIATWFWQAYAPGWCNNRHVWAGANLRTSGSDQPPRCHLRLGHLEGWGHEGGWTLPAPAQHPEIGGYAAYEHGWGV